jgi:hypothetical protein
VANRPKAVIAVSVASLVVLTNLAGLLHHATVRHVRCVEHDELIHVGAARAEPFERLRPDDAVSSSSAEPSSGHHHCGVLLCSRERDAVLAVDDSGDPRLVEARGGDCAACSVRVGGCVYRVAPKTSPPAQLV